MNFSNLTFLSNLKFSNMIMTSISIENKLAKPNCSIEELLEEEEIIQEMRNQNQSLLNYLKKDNIVKLVDYIIKEPKEDDIKTGHKFPFVANELLNCGESGVLDYFYNTNEEMEKIMASNAKPELKTEDDNVKEKEKDTDDNEELKQETANENKEDKEEKDTDAIGEDNSTPPSLDTINESKSIEIKPNENEHENIITNKTDEEPTTESIVQEQVQIQEAEPEHKPTSNSNRIDLLDYLLSFIETDKELNYVLVGYFTKFISLLLIKKPLNIIKYIYSQRPELFKHLIHHNYSKGINDLLSKLLLFENCISEREKDSQEQLPQSLIQDEMEYESLYPLRTNAIVSLFDNIDLINDNSEKTSHLFTLLSQLIENKMILNDIIDNQDIVSKLFAWVQTDTYTNKNNQYIGHNYSEMVSFLIALIKAIILHGTRLPSYEVNDELVEQGNSSQEINHSLLSKALFTIGFDALFSNYSFKSSSSSSQLPLIPSTYDKPYTPLGSHRVKIIELIANLFPYMKNIYKEFDAVLIKGSFFPNTFDYLIKHEWNNIFQLSFSLLFKNYLNDAEHHKDLSKFLFEDYKLLAYIQKHITQENKFSFESGRTISRGYTAILISLSYKINTIGGGNRVMIHNKSREGSISFVNTTNITDILKMQNTISVSNSSGSNTRRSQAAQVKVCDVVSNYLKESWNEFFKDNVANIIKRFEKRLCEVNTATNDSDIGKSTEELVIGGEDGNKKIGGRGIESNAPFQSKDDNFFSDDSDGNDNQKDYFDISNDVDMNDFEFTDETKRKDGKEEDFLKENPMKVDELDNDSNVNYNTFTYWKEIKSANHSQEINEALKELNLD